MSEVRSKQMLKAEAKYIKDYSLSKLIDLLEEVQQSDLEALEAFVMIEAIETQINLKRGADG